MKRILAALSLSLLANASFAQSAEGYGLTRVDDPRDCPAGATTVHPNYKWQEGRIVRDGWTCQKVYAR